MSDKTNSVNILISKRYALKIASLSELSVSKFSEPEPESNSNPLALATPILLPGKFVLREPASVPLAAEPPSFAKVKLSCKETSLYGTAISPAISGLISGEP